MVDSAIEHRLGGQLLSAVDAGRVQVDIEDHRRLLAGDLSSTAHHERLWTALVAALDALESVGINALAIKGVAEESRWYDRMGERPCSDVDLVLVPEHVDRIGEALDVLGPDRADSEAITGLVSRRLLQHVHMEWEGITLDLHLDPLKLGLWTRSDLIMATATSGRSPDGRSVSMLAPEIALVGFLTHLNKDRFSYLGAFLDVARILQYDRLDWDLVRRFVSDEALEIPVWRSLGVVVDALDLDVEVPHGDGWRGELWDRLWPPSIRLQGHEGRSSHRRRQDWLPLLTTDRWREVRREARRQLIPPRALLDVHQPELADHGYLRRITCDRVRA